MPLQSPMTKLSTRPRSRVWLRIFEEVIWPPVMMSESGRGAAQCDALAMELVRGPGLRIADMGGLGQAMRPKNGAEEL
jgi:hypothetical protein